MGSHSSDWDSCTPIEGAAERDHGLPQQQLGLVHAHGQRLTSQGHRGVKLFTAKGS